MDISTKFNVNNKVYLMHNNKVVQGTVRVVKTITNQKNANASYTTINYQVSFDEVTAREVQMAGDEYNESDLFPSKADLLASL